MITASASDSMGSKISHGDKTFLEKAAKSGMQEVAVSQGAMDRLMNAEVKSFASMMVTDHTAAGSELTALAASKGVMLPPKDKDVTEKMEKWSKKNKNVDEDYVKQMVSDHEDAVKLFQKATKSDDPDISAFAAKTLPTLQHHLDMAKGLKTTVK